MQKIVEAPRVAPDLAPYMCPITGDWISGRAAHENNLAKHGCRVLEPGEKEAVERRKRQADAALESAIEATIEKEIHEMPARKREKLEAQLDNFNLSVGKA